MRQQMRPQMRQQLHRQSAPSISMYEDVSIVASAAMIAVLILVVASVALALKFMRGIVETPPGRGNKEAPPARVARPRRSHAPAVSSAGSLSAQQ